MVVVEGTIKGKARPRVFGKHAITPEDTVTYENWVKICYQQQDGKYNDGPVKAVINVYHKIPKSFTKKRLKVIREGLDFPQKKPDVDNIAKIVLDSLNGIAYKDDSQVIELAIIKRWTEEQERVEFELQELK
jgi:Holliday junction resolvase RusA-like endonuclease